MERLGVEGRLVLAFSLGGGTLGGLLVATVGFLGKMTPSAALVTTILLFGAGAVLGWVHAVFLCCVGYRQGASHSEVVKHLLRGALYAPPALLLGFATAYGIGISGVLLRVGSGLVILAAALCWLAGAAICVWAVTVGLEAFHNACARYPEARIAPVLVLLLLATLLFVFAQGRPEVWTTNYRVTTAGAAILAVGVTVGLEAPLLVLLHLVYRIVPRHRHRIAADAADESGRE